MSDFTFSITNVYGPAVHADAQHFLDSLRAIPECTLGAWVVAGDFNLIRGKLTKNNSNINHALCFLFNSSIDALALTELPLLDRRFTWSNGRDDPTMERLDRIFFNSEMSILFPNSSITSQTRDVSDHTLGSYMLISCPWCSLPGKAPPRLSTRRGLWPLHLKRCVARQRYGPG